MSSKPQVVVGIDAGATKTAAAMGTLAGDGVRRLRTGPSAVVGMPDERAIRVLRGVVDAFAPNRADLAHVAIGLSGVDFPDEYAAQHAALVEGLDVSPDRLLLVNDSVVALAGAASGERATLVQHGTEVTMAWRAAAGAEEVFDSVGIADCFDLRHRVVPVVARMLDGRVPRSCLVERVLAHCGVTAEAFPQWMMRDPNARDRILRAAPVVFAAWQDGDGAAAHLVEQAIEDYVVATIAMAQRMGPGAFEACFGGGTLNAGGPRLIEAIAARLSIDRPDAVVRTPAAAPEDGALALARLAANRASIGSATGVLPA